MNFIKKVVVLSGFLPVLAFANVDNSNQLPDISKDELSAEKTMSDSMDKTTVSNKNNNQSSLPVQKNYIYKTAFDGDYDIAYKKAFAMLVTDLSKGATNPEEISVDISSLISEEMIGDDEIEIYFDGQEVQKLLDSGQISVWNGLNSPLVVWYIEGPKVANYLENLSNINEGDTFSAQTEFDNQIETTNEVRIFSSSFKLNLFTQKLLLKGKDNKVNILYPMIDLEDIQNITVSDVMKGATDKIAKASARYTSDYGVSIMLYTSESDLTMVYHLVKISTGEEIATDSISGSIDDVIENFYAQVRHSVSTSSSNVYLQGVNSQNTMLSGFDDVSSLSLGPVDSTHFQILIKGLRSFNDVVILGRNLKAIGFKQVDVVNIKGSDAIFSIIHDSSLNPEQKLLQHPHLKQIQNNVYSVVGAVSEFSQADKPTDNVIESTENTQNMLQSDENNATNSVMPYNVDDDTIKDTSVPKPQKYQDPNKKLWSGSSVAK